MTADKERLIRHVESLAAIQPPRNPENRESLDRTSEYIFRRWEEAGLSPRFQDFQVRGLKYRNVLVNYGPLHGPRLVLGAHYDVCGDTPGADDDASGVAAILELGRLLATQKPKLPFGIEMAAYTLEEPPFFGTSDMGSHHHARLLSETGVKVKLMLNLEMIGYFSDEPGSQEVPHGQEGIYPSVGNFVLVVGAGGDPALTGKVQDELARNCECPVQSIHFPYTDGLAGMSDQSNFWKFGFPALMVSDSNFYRNPHYHKPSDLPETLDYTRMTQVVDALYRFLLEYR